MSTKDTETEPTTTPTPPSTSTSTIKQRKRPGHRPTTKEKNKLPGGVTYRMLNKFLNELEEVPNVNFAASRAGFRSDRQLYKLRQKNPRFAAAWDFALQKAVGKWEHKSARRAFEGIDEPVFQMGKRVGVVRKYSDLLAMKMLEAHHPLYKKRVEVSGADGQPIGLTFASLARKASVSTKDLPLEEDEDGITHYGVEEMFHK